MKILDWPRCSIFESNFNHTEISIPLSNVCIHIRFYMCRDSSVGRASDWRSEGPWFDPESRQFFFVRSIKFFWTILSFQNLCHCKISFLLGESKWNALVWFSANQALWHNIFIFFRQFSYVSFQSIQLTKFTDG